MKFTLQITLENDAMSSEADIGRALVAIGKRLAAGSENAPEEQHEKIRDSNGNTVGFWEIAED